jgi:hypothetical protein
MKGSGGKHWGRRKEALHFAEKRSYILSVASLCTAWIADAVETHGNV